MQKMVLKGFVTVTVTNGDESNFLRTSFMYDPMFDEGRHFSFLSSFRKPSHVSKGLNTWSRDAWSMMRRASRGLHPICPPPAPAVGDRKVNRIKEFLLDGRRRRNPEGRPLNANASGRLLMTGVS